MQLTEIDYPDAQPIESYGPDFFRIGDDKIAAPALVHAKGATVWGGLDDPAKVSDPLFVCDPKAKTYVPLSPAVFAEIESGERRL